MRKKNSGTRLATLLWALRRIRSLAVLLLSCNVRPFPYSTQSRIARISLITLGKEYNGKIEKVRVTFRIGQDKDKDEIEKVQIAQVWEIWQVQIENQIKEQVKVCQVGTKTSRCCQSKCWKKSSVWSFRSFGVKLSRWVKLRFRLWITIWKWKVNHRQV